MRALMLVQTLRICGTGLQPCSSATLRLQRWCTGPKSCATGVSVST